MHIAITGNIGAGKTTLATLLAEQLGWEVFYEVVDDNPYLKEFYEDMPRWAFHTQVFFLTTRFDQVHRIKQSSKNIIQDRTIYEDAYIFATNLYESGIMPQRDFNNYMGLFRAVSNLVKPPDLIIYLKADLEKLTRQIRQRNREYERNLSLEYLSNLNIQYDRWTSHYTDGRLLVVDSNQLDFLHNPEHLSTLIRNIRQELAKATA
jgi:deoxyadenosine/deoxycytidine kinase